MRSALGSGGTLPEEWCLFEAGPWRKGSEDKTLCLQNSHWPVFHTFLPGSQANTGILAHWSWWCIELHSDSQNYHRGWYEGEPWVEKTHKTSHWRMNRKKKNTLTRCYLIANMNWVLQYSKYKYSLALLPVAFRTGAGVTIHRIGAVGSVLTLVILAVIEVDVTVLSYVPWSAVTSVWTSR